MNRLLRHILSVDLRALALMRIGIGLVLLADLAIRWPDLATFYTRDGTFPVRYITSAHITSKHFHLYRWLDSEGGAACLFLIAALAAACVALGLHTRVSLVASWFLLTSLHHRNTFVLDMGDVYLRIILLWCIFLPVGARYSWDALHNKHWQALPNRFFSLATCGFILQVSVVYGVAGILKSDPVWTTSGDALFFALSIDQFSTGFARSLLDYPALLRPLSFLALGSELMAPVLICSPFKTAWTRGAAVALLTCFHLAVATCLHLGLLVPVCVIVLIGLWPTPWMDFLQSRPRWKCEEEPLQNQQLVAASPDQTVPDNYLLSAGARAFATSLIVYTVVQNVVEIPQLHIKPYSVVIQPIANYGRLFGVLQSWRLFAPYPFRDDGWFIIEGYQGDSMVVDLLSRSPVSYFKPTSVSSQFKNQRWRRFYQNLWRRANPQHIPYFCRWAMDQWNRSHPEREQVTRLRFVFVRELTQAPGVPTKLESFVLGQYPSLGIETEGVDDGCHEQGLHHH